MPADSIVERISKGSGIVESLVSVLETKGRNILLSSGGSWAAKGLVRKTHDVMRKNIVAQNLLIFIPA
jgi:hypothetical protein